ncbi:YggS family pyridoxal phosphate-dependent enzyme [Gordonia liuliyuniae]|uniref:Pyridoxal phosphate homeostasis protein n=1 Tax=Gordonia liuliyuniae TaxID=2911517 RepID=A0ABS9IUP4_9ACTN|nr:YggS family pyridoxal phosphate-dependent enzyme [Gordonia liuliyuniae]MCF8589282.1 YggS family pyridoxal phosphate-dependent enzyme [Gordonia liuliyuniae]
MTGGRRAELATALAAARERVAVAERATGRAHGDVALLVVTKFFPAADVEHLIDLGVREFGESREPEASRKVAQIRADRGDIVFDADMIGRVQRKKARSVSRWARRVHSVDSIDLVDALGGAARRSLDDGERTDPLGVLLQMSLDGDPERGGLVESDLRGAADRVAGHADELRLDGLMVIAPLGLEPEEAMARAAGIRERFVADHPGARELSAGMSGDLEQAIAHGSTCVRVGTAIMGARPILSP